VLPVSSYSFFFVNYIATAQIYDDEFAKRVEHHQNRRPKDWSIIEAPFNLAETLSQHDKVGQCIIVDCLTLWLAQCICPDCAPPEGCDWAQERSDLLTILPKLKSTILLVSNEVGMGIVPLGEINRQFQDEQGRLNQAIAKVASQVSFIAAGLPIKLKG
jgi:adenosylcobinamide kinase/adenosylcobinamide-phosphate guanylyltransferase